MALSAIPLSALPAYGQDVGTESEFKALETEDIQDTTEEGISLSPDEDGDSAVPGEAAGSAALDSADGDFSEDAAAAADTISVDADAAGETVVEDAGAVAEESVSEDAAAAGENVGSDAAAEAVSEDAGAAAEESVSEDAAAAGENVGSDAAGENVVEDAGAAAESVSEDTAAVEEAVVENAQSDGDGQGSICFNVDDSRIFSDGTYNFTLETEGITEDYEVALQVGHFDDGGIVEEYTEGTEYAFDGQTLTIYGDKVREKGYFYFNYLVKAVSKADQRVLCQDSRVFESLDAVESYSFKEDSDLLPGWDDIIHRDGDVFVKNAEHPNGEQLSYQVTDVRIESQNPEKEGEQVLEIIKEEESSDKYWWNFIGKNYGSAVVCVDYINLQGENASYTFNVYVKPDVYGVDFTTDDGSFRGLPGETLQLVTNTWHHSVNQEDEGVTDGLVYAWNLKTIEENPEADTLASITPSGDGKTASVVFRELQDGEENCWYDMTVEVFIYKGSVSEENKVGYRNGVLVMADSYNEVWPRKNNRNLEVGAEEELTAEFRMYPGTGGNEYDYPSEGEVYYRWSYDPDVMQIFDEDGVLIGNYDSEGNYNTSEKSKGKSRRFSIRRLKNRDSAFKLEGIWIDGDGNEHWESNEFWLDRKDYKVFFNDLDDNRVLSDGKIALEVRTEGIPEGLVYGTDYNIDLTVGIQDEEGFTQVFTEGTDYTFDGKNVTVFGDKLAERGITDDRNISVRASLMMDGENFWEDWRDLLYLEARADYHMMEDDETLPNNYWRIYHYENVFVRNAEHPDGEDMKYTVVDVKLEDQKPEEEGKDVLSIEKLFPDDDNTSEYYFWNIRSLNYGSATGRVDYIDFEGKEASYTFNIYVKTDVYGVDFTTDDGSFIGLPGETLQLVTNTWHNSVKKEEEGVTDGLVYAWNLKTIEGNPEADTLASITPSGDGKTASVVLRELQDGEENCWYNMAVEVFIYKGSVSEENKVGYRVKTLTLADSYKEVWPKKINNQLEVGEEQEVTAEFRLYPGKEGGEYDLPEEGTVDYFWFYDEQVIQILDEDGIQVGNISEGGEYKGSDKSRGNRRKFTIRRLKAWDTSIRLEALWTDESGEEHRDQNDFYLERKDYRLNFGDLENDWVYSDGNCELEVLTEGIPEGAEYGKDYSIDLQAGINDYGTFEELFTEGTEYTFDGKTVKIYGNKLAEREIDNKSWISLIAKLNLNGVDVGDAYTELEYREARAEYEIDDHRDMLPGWDGAIGGTMRARLENTEYPDGLEKDLEVVKVEVISDTPLDSEGGNVLAEFHEDHDDDNPDLKWWYYRAGNLGSASLRITYKDFDGEEASCDMLLNVRNDVYHMNLWTVNGQIKGLPGSTIELQAQGTHLYIEGGEYIKDASGLTYKWSIDEGSDFAAVVVNPDDSSRATLEIYPLGEDVFWLDETIVVKTTLVDKEGNDVAHILKDLYISSDYNVISPFRIEPDLGVGSRLTVDSQLLHCPGPDGTGSEVVKSNVHFRWYYDENVLEVLDKDGKKIGNEDQDGKYIDSEASYTQGEDSCPFTIHRIGNQDTNIRLEAEWTDSFGDVHQEPCDYWLTDVPEAELKDQEISAGDVTMTMFDDATASVSGAKGELSYESGDESIVKVDGSGKLTPAGVGSAVVTVRAAATDEYREGVTTFNVTVEKLDLSKTVLTTNAPAAGYTYNGKTRKPSVVTVTYNDRTLTEGTDYTVAFSSNLINAGNKTVAVRAKGTATTGSNSIKYTINKAAQTLTLTASASRVAVGKTVTVKVSGAKGTKTFKTSSPARSSVTSAGVVKGKKVGTVKITVTSAATANYKKAVKQITINVVPPATTKLTAANQATGIKLTWAKVTGANGYLVYRGKTRIATITSGSTVTFVDKKANTNGTKYTFGVFATASNGISTISKNISYYRMARPAIKSVKNGSAKKTTVTWGKNAKGTGYQIQYSLNSNFSKAKTVTVSNAATVSKVISNLTKGSTYYFRMRSYKRDGKVNYYSLWSAAKKLKIVR